MSTIRKWKKFKMRFRKCRVKLVLMWKTFLAATRLSKRAVCEMSRGRGLWNDFHDYPDATHPFPLHFREYQCKRCGKTFII